jgi:hypothetical protein
MILAGGPGASGTYSYQGYVYVWYHPLNSATGWVEQTPIQSINPKANSSFGIKMVMTNDGKTAFIGNPNDTYGSSNVSSINVYKWENNSWNFRIRQVDPSLNTTNFFAQTMAIDASGRTVAVGASGINTFRGTVYLYNYSYNSNLGDSFVRTQQITPLTQSTYDSYGQPVCLSSDSSKLFIGGANYRKVDVYYRDLVSGNYFLYTTINEFYSYFASKFGGQAQCSSDGSMIVISDTNTIINGMNAVGTCYIVANQLNTYSTTGKFNVNTDVDSTSSSKTLLNVKGYAQKIFGPGTFEMTQLESHDSSPVVLTTGMIGSPTAINQGYYMNVSEPNVSTNRVLALQTQGGKLGIGTTIPQQTLHIQGFSYFSSNVGIATAINPAVALFVNGIIRNTNPYLYIAGTGGTVSHTAGSSIKFNSTLVDTHSGYNTSTYTYTVPITGLYSIKMNAYTEVSVPAFARIYLSVNATNVAILFTIPASATQISCSGSTDYRLNVGDRVTFITNVATSYYLVNTNPYHSFATIRFIG